MKILVTGSSGMIGSALVPYLKKVGHDVRPLVRKAGREGIGWNPRTGELDEAALRPWGQPDAVIHLAGENIAGKRWNHVQKKRLHESRVLTTQLLCAALLRQAKPRVFINASAVGFYGNSGEQVVNEDNDAGNDFLARLCVDWENAAKPLSNIGVRVIQLRFGLVLTPKGGALEKMLPLFRCGLGGRLGSGLQWISWIAMDDLLRVVQFALETPALHGPVNTVAPEPVRNRDFSRALAKALHRPTLLPVPAFVLRMAFGEIADALMLSSQRALPERLELRHFKFNYPRIDGALASIFGKK